MVQDQLIDYISAQLKLGVAKDAIRSSLIGAGWLEIDIEDTMKKVDSVQTSAPAASPVASPKTEPASSASTNAAKSSGAPQTIKVSDLVSAADAAVTVSSPVKTDKKAAPLTKEKEQPAKMADFSSMGKIKGNEFEANVGPHPHGRLLSIIEIVVIVLLALLSGWLYFQNISLSSQVKTLSTQSTNVISQLNTLQKGMDATTTALAAQVASLTSQNQDLMISLSFFTVPAGATSSAPEAVSLNGTLSGGGKLPYVLTTSYGVRALLSNLTVSKDATTTAFLAPLIGKQISVSGAHLPGTQSVTVTQVNGAPLPQ